MPSRSTRSLSSWEPKSKKKISQNSLDGPRVKSHDFKSQTFRLLFIYYLFITNKSYERLQTSPPFLSLLFLSVLPWFPSSSGMHVYAVLACAFFVSEPKVRCGRCTGRVRVNEHLFFILIYINILVYLYACVNSSLSIILTMIIITN